MKINKHHRPIGIFDSGVGGLSVLKEVRRQYPLEDWIYIADQIHVPYGPRSREEVLGYSEGIVRYLLGKGAKLIIVACNTASAVALAELRKKYPDVPFVGMEPAVKPAAEGTGREPTACRQALALEFFVELGQELVELLEVVDYEDRVGQPPVVGRFRVGDFLGPRDNDAEYGMVTAGDPGNQL